MRWSTRRPAANSVAEGGAVTRADPCHQDAGIQRCKAPHDQFDAAGGHKVQQIGGEYLCATPSASKRLARSRWCRNPGRRRASISRHRSSPAGVGIWLRWSFRSGDARTLRLVARAISATSAQAFKAIGRFSPLSMLQRCGRRSADKPPIVFVIRSSLMEHHRAAEMKHVLQHGKAKAHRRWLTLPKPRKAAASPWSCTSAFASRAYREPATSASIRGAYLKGDGHRRRARMWSSPQR